MAIKSFIKYWGIFCLLALNLFVGGCSDGETLPADQSESTFVDSLLVSMYDSMYVSPVSAEQTFRNAQKGISDSISYYKLELFAAFSGGLQGRIDEAMDDPNLSKYIIDSLQYNPYSMMIWQTSLHITRTIY